jgi:hypothetical protein
MQSNERRVRMNEKTTTKSVYPNKDGCQKEKGNVFEGQEDFD